MTFELRPREQVALLGAPGSGKTTLLRSVALIQKPAAGRVFFEAEELTRLPEARLRGLRRSFQFTGGHPARALWAATTVAQTVREPLQIHRLGNVADQAARVNEALQLFGVPPWLLNRPISSLSIAMRQRVILARAFVLKPRLLLNDEVIDHLEPAAALPLLEHLADLCRRHALTWLWSTSNAELARRFSDRVLTLENGRLASA
jgi:ABC-type glutathione transport system ATPase component